jgi:hypothetical protein
MARAVLSDSEWERSRNFLPGKAGGSRGDGQGQPAVYGSGVADSGYGFAPAGLAEGVRTSASGLYALQPVGQEWDMGQLIGFGAG